MKCLLLGEGPTDLGSKAVYPESGIKKGPMTMVIDALVAAQGVYDVEYDLLSRVEVKNGLKRSKRMVSSRPKEIDKDRQAIFRAAWYLGSEAAKSSKDLSVYFHDPDHTHSDSGRTAFLVEDAMLKGFEFARYDQSVPMVPNPRSEAWLLAYFQKGFPGQREYNKAERFEDLPANDDSPKSAKRMLQEAVGADSESETYKIVMERIDEIDWNRVRMPSYDRFRERLERVLNVQCPSFNERG